jgi:hypothetical protein
MEAKRQIEVKRIEGKYENLDEMVLSGNNTYIDQIKDRLDFLNYILRHSMLTLSVNQVDILWKSVIMEPLTLREREEGFKWLENSLCQAQVKIPQ